MFFEVFCVLCEKRGISVTKATVEMGLSRTIGTKWRKTGAVPNGETLNTIANYFGVTTDYLLGTTAEAQLDVIESRLRTWDAKLDFAETEEQRVEAEKEIKRLTEEQKRLNAKIAETKKAPAPEGERKPDIEDIKLALFGGDGEVTDEMWEEALFAAEMIKARYKRKKAQDE